VSRTPRLPSDPDDEAERSRWQAGFLRRVYALLEQEADEAAGKD
jgi:hypothetical protein